MGEGRPGGAIAHDLRSMTAVRHAGKSSFAQGRDTGKRPTLNALRRRMSTRIPTFMFADLAGFSVLTEKQGDEHAAELATRFRERISELLPQYDATEIKAIG